MDLEDAEQRELLLKERKRGVERRLLRVRAIAVVSFAIIMFLTFFGGLETGRWTESDTGFFRDLRAVRIAAGLLVLAGLFVGERWAKRDRFPYLAD